VLGGSDSSAKRENLALRLKDRFGLGKDYLLVWFGRTVSIIGDTIGGMAISLLILDRTGSATALSLGMVANLIPPLILGPVAGVILDRTDRKNVMMICDAVRGILTLVLGFVLLTGKFTLANALATSLAPVSVLGGGILIDRFGSWRLLYGLGWLIMGAGLSVFMVPELRKAFGPKDR
jgi:MFS family permease